MAKPEPVVVAIATSLFGEPETALTWNALVYKW